MNPLLFGQRSISQDAPLPVELPAQATSVVTVSGETVQMVVASTNVNSAGEAAGTVVYFRLAKSGILDSAGNRVGHKDDTSFAFVTGTLLTTQVTFPNLDWEQLSNDRSTAGTRAAKMAEIGSRLTNGQFVLDHRTGLGIGKKATTANTDTAGYKYRTQQVTVDSEFPAAAAMADASANPTTTNVDARNMTFNGTTWDRMRSGVVTPTATLTGIQNQLPWAVYNATPTVRTEGQGGPLQGNTNGDLKTDLGTKIAGEDLTNDRMKTEYQGSGVMYTADQLVKTGAGHLHTLTLTCTDATPTAGHIDVYDNTSAAGTKIASIEIAATYFLPLTLTFDVTFATGLYIDFTTTADVGVTPSYR